MPREKPSYRDNIERIKERYPDKEILTVKEVSTFCGVCTRTTKKLYEFTDGYISVAKLAREMS